jgi:hydroxymethylglutaryl-CoA lyase
MNGMPASVIVRDVGPRDGLQPEAPVAVEGRVRLIEALIAAGVTRIEAVAFVSPKAVPAMSGAAEVLAAVGRPDGVRLSALVPNVKGAELALDAGVDELTVTISISETYNQRNVRMSTDQSEVVIGSICSTSGAVPVDAVVSCGFGSPYEGEVAPSEVGALVDRLRVAGCAAVTLADTTGMATPRRIDDVLTVTGVDVGLHLHDTRGTALVNAYAAMQAGVARFDTSVGGLGGSPFAHGATGNLATEELVAVLDDLGVHTGIDVEGLVAAAAVASELVGRPVPSRVAVAGPRSRLAAVDR